LTVLAVPGKPLQQDRRGRSMELSLPVGCQKSIVDATGRYRLTKGTLRLRLLAFVGGGLV
jgi:hypothetical protein